jgi:uncharacterized phage-associated protein
MQLILIILIIVLFSILIGTVGFEYFNQYSQERELESLIVSCMEQYGHYSDQLVACLNDDSLTNP